MIGKWREQLDSKLRGQSEVLGVALLTAVVVILVATVALFLFTDFASNANDEQLLATVESDVTSENITITHQGGDSFDPDNVSVQLRGDTSYDAYLSEFSDPADDASSFAPGDSWTDGNLTLAGEFRLLVIDEKSNTILHDQTHEVKIEDVRLLVEDGPDSGSFTTNDITMLGANPDDVALSDIQREYRVQVKYNTGEGWQNQTGGTSNLGFDPAGTLYTNGTTDEGGILEASKPSGSQTDVDVSTSTDTSNQAVDDNISSNEVTVTVVDADLDTTTTITGITAAPGAASSGFDNKALVDWQIESDSNVKPQVDVIFSLDDQNDDPIPIDAADTSNANCADGAGESIECAINFDSASQTLTSGSGLPVIEADVDPDTTEVNATVEPVPSDEPFATTDTQTNSFDAANFEVTTLGASFDGVDEKVVSTIEVTNTGDWTAENTITVTATARDGTGTELASQELTESDTILAPGDTIDQNNLNNVYDTIPGKTDSVEIEVDTEDNVDSVTNSDMEPAEFLFETPPSAQVVSEFGQDKVEVSYELKNVGDLTNTQTISLAADGSTVDTRDTQLGPGETTGSTSLSTGPISSATWFNGQGQYSFTVDTSDTVEDDTITIETPDYNLTIDDVRRTYSGGEDRIEVDYTIENAGDLSGTRDINTTFTFTDAGGTELDEEYTTESGLSLGGGDSVSRTESAVIDDYRTSEIEIEIFANDSNGNTDGYDSTTFGVDPGNVELTIQSAESSPDSDPGQMVVTYKLENTGDLSRSTYVNLVKLGSNSRTMANTSDRTGNSIFTLKGGEAMSDTIKGQLENGDVESGTIDIRVNATDDGQASSEKDRSVSATPATVNITSVSWTQSGGEMTVDSYTIENVGDTPSQSQQLTYTVDYIDNTGVGASDLLDDIKSAIDGFQESDSIGVLNATETESGDFTGTESFVVTDVLSSYIGDFDELELQGVLNTNDDTAKSSVWTVDPPTYEPTIVDATHDVGAQEITTEWIVENTGDFSDGEKDIRYIVNGDEKEVISEEVPAGDTISGTFTASVSGPSPVSGDGAVINATVSTTDGTATELVDVDPHYFKIDTADFNFQPATASSDAKVEVTSYTVTNTGDFSGTQDIEFVVNGNVVDSDTATLAAGGGSTSGSLSATVDQSDLTGINDVINLELRTDNESETTTLDRKAANFAITDINAKFENEQAKLTTWTVENTGDFTDTQDIEFLVNGNQRDSVNRQLAPGETTSGSFSDGVSESVLDINNEFTVSLSTDNATETRTLSAQPASFDITNVNFDFQPATSSDPAQAWATSYTVENTGDFTDTQDITFLIGNDQRDSVNRQLGPGGTDSGSFSTSISETNQFTVKLQTQDDSASNTYNPNPSYLEITSYSLNFNNGQATGTYTVENTGDFVADRDIDFEVDGNSERTDTVSVAPKSTTGDSASGSFSAQAPDPGTNNYDLEVAIDSQDERVSDTFTVDTAYFQVTVNDATYQQSTQSASVDYTIENTGDFTDSQTIVTEEQSNNNQATQTVSLDPGNSQSRTSSVSIESVGTTQVEVRSDDDQDQGSVYVSGPDFNVKSVSASYDRSNEQALVDFTVKNEGDLQGTQDIDVTTDPGGAGGSNTFSDTTLNPGGTFSQTNVAINIYNSGSIDLVVSTDGDSARDTINVDPGNIVFTDYSISDDPVESGNSFTASYTVKNTGDLGEWDYVNLHVDGDNQYDYDYVNLDPGEDTSGTITYTTGDSDLPGVGTRAKLNYGSAESRYEYVEVNTDPTISSFSVSDNSGSNCIGWTACTRWDYTADLDASYSVDDPAYEFDRAEVTFDNLDGNTGTETFTSSSKSNTFDYSQGFTEWFWIGSDSFSVELRIYRDGQGQVGSQTKFPSASY